jgi:luciferase family oxidoreductase group 1
VKFSVLQFFSWPERRGPLEQVYARALERIDVMDQSGFDAVWLAEHHFSTYSVCPSVHLMGMHVANRTRNLRIGTAVSLAPFYHPLRLAEEVALLDVLSGGRVNWGAGRGFDEREFRAFGVTREDSYPRFREHVEVVLEAWKQERLTFEGRFCSYRDVEVLPKPLQKPHPPVWLAASSPEAIGWAAEHGHSILMDPHSSHVEIARKRAFYREQLEAHGHSIEGREIPIARLLAIADSDAEAREVARQGAAWTVGSYAGPKAGSFDLRSPAARAAGTEPAADPVERYLQGVILHGTPDRVAGELERLREELPLDSLMCAPLSHRTFELFTEKVLPRFL